jgi:hypothetical protein
VEATIYSSESYMVAARSFVHTISVGVEIRDFCCPEILPAQARRYITQTFSNRFPTGGRSLWVKARRSTGAGCGEWSIISKRVNEDEGEIDHEQRPDISDFSRGGFGRFGSSDQ